MSKPVKCKFCGEFLQKEDSDCVPVSNSNRYAHEKCLDKEQKRLHYVDLIHKKMKELCGNTYIRTKINKQIKQFAEDGINEREIYNTLIYWYDVKKSNPMAANGGIGIVPYVHVDATRYMKKEYKRKHQYENLNSNKVQREISLRDKKDTITMTAPTIKTPKRKHFFNLE